MSTVVLDVNGNGSLLQQVGYQYDPGGLRRQLTLPDGKTVSYQYNTRRQLTNMTDWAGQSTGYGYDGLGRLGAAFRPNGLLSQYSYDAASRLLTLRHSANGHTLASFNYTVDARGNRTQALESMAGAGTPGTTTLPANDSSINYYRGSWTVNGSLMTSVDSSAALRVPFFGTQATLTMGTGSDHSVFDIYLDGDLWSSADGYATATGTQTFSLTLNTDGPHTLEVRNRPERNLGNTTQPAVYRLDMSGLSFIGQPAVVRTTIYTYDSVSRLRTADSFAGLNGSGTALQHYAYSYDLAGNRTQAVAPAGTTNFTYDSANHLLTSQLGAGAVVNYTYDHAGRLTNDGTNTYTWDGANRLLSVGSTSYLYNGSGQRMQQTVGATVTQYLLDTQPGLAKVLTATTSANVTRYVHGPMGVQAQQSSDATWHQPLQDGLGSVRGVVDATNTPQESRFYDPYGNETQQSGSQQTVFGFTGEEMDSNGLLNLRARYYNPTLGQFLSLDPFEGDAGQPLSLDSYAYVQENPVNMVDPSGLFGEKPVLCLVADNCSQDNAVSISPFTGTQNVRKDRTDTSLFNQWGVILTVKCDMADNIKWDDPLLPQQKQHLESAFTVVDQRLKDATDGAYGFFTVFGGLEIRHASNGQIGDYGNAITPQSLNGYLMEWGDRGRSALNAQAPNIDTQDNIIHELGHALDYRTGHTSSSSDPTSMYYTAFKTRFNLSAPSMYGGTRKQRGKSDDPEEWLADHFLNWVRLSYSAGINSQIQSGSQYDPHIKDYNTRLIAAFWLGVNLNQSADGTGASLASSPGMQLWASIASLRGAQGVLAFRNVTF